MTDRKHVIVGLFVLVGLILLGIMIIWFEGMAFMIRGGYSVLVHMPDAMGIREGKRVHLDGIEVGEVSSLVSSQPDKPGVWVGLRIKKNVLIPREAVFVAQQTAVGDVFMDFQTTGKITGYLPKDGMAKIEGISKPPNLVPEGLMRDLQAAFAQFNGAGDLIANLKELTAPRTLKDVQAGKPRNLWTALEQFEETAKGLQGEMADPKSEFNQLLATARGSAKDLSEALAKARETFDGANKALARIDDAAAKAGKMMDNGAALAEKLAKDSERLAALIDNMNGMVADLRAGKGSLGKLTTSDELHRALVTLIENLRTMTDNANRLVTMWREEGVLAKEKK